ncbi:hypothetical protein ZOSMA_31G00395 [Zostera marina]|uniref:DNA polymerase delta subunit 4 n=1 Tax=Zostera marina TaxID=29655 RepID=A0A0K9P8Y9_ZOSMR|nr:hypothetical protein ZOSMA_31G00395 [Zostera marina]
MPTNNVQDFYRQVKSNRKDLGFTKSESSAKKKTHLSEKQTTAAGAKEECEWERLLTEFDMDMKYGPCSGMKRLERWERAVKMDLNPPTEIGNFLKTMKIGDPKRNCILEGKLF